jgi:hypothetical protein
MVTFAPSGATREISSAASWPLAGRKPRNKSESKSMDGRITLAESHFSTTFIPFILQGQYDAIKSHKTKTGFDGVMTISLKLGCVSEESKCSLGIRASRPP